jgi:hypothetical protein
VASAAQTGFVVVTTHGCSGRYVAETSGGYVLLEWFGGRDPSTGDSIKGDLHSFGMKELLIAGSQSKAWIDDYYLSKSRVIEKLEEHDCDF